MVMTLLSSIEGNYSYIDVRSHCVLIRVSYSDIISGNYNCPPSLREYDTVIVMFIVVQV